MPPERDIDPTHEITHSEVEGEQSDDLAQLAWKLAAEHSTTTLETDASTYLVRYLGSYESASKSAYLRFREMDEGVLAISHAAEWTLDNYYIIQRTLRQIRQDLPFGFYEKLPKLQSGPFEGFPRIFELSVRLIEDENADLNIPDLKWFLASYQSKRSLTMGELWSLPSMLRFVLLAGLVEALVRITHIEWDPSGEVLSIGAQFLESNDDTIVANCFTSLRTLSAQNWKDFFEEHSLVEQLLRADPAGIYSQLDFDTRDRYRAEVEKLALATGADELEVARRAIQSAVVFQRGQDGAPQGEFRRKVRDAIVADDWSGLNAARQSHIGYFLIGDGRETLESKLGYQPRGEVRLARWVLNNPLPVYLTAIAILTLALLWLVVGYISAAGGTYGQMISGLVLGAIPATTVAVSLVNFAVTRAVSPRILPKLNFESGVPESCGTMVVVPSILSGEGDIASFLQEIELHYLRNPDPNLGFALLTDFPDADYEHIPEDEELVKKLVHGIQALNERYAGEGDSPFYLFHRRRRWNASEGVWMGWERKRGKLVEFNRLLSGSRETSIYIQEGDLTKLSGVRYVITLDADTVLPQGSAARLVATLAHPLNRAKFDPQSGELIAGYTLLQPRTEVKPTSANKSYFARIYSGDVGLDLYTRAVSDVYQDLFGDGIFVGKGIYDVEAFERSVEGRVPENALLSHDLFEGLHGRVGLVSDVVLYEDFPSNYVVYIHRLHRWIRGDWQLLPWIFPHVPHGGEGFIANKLSGLAIWKIVDNLRRSLIAPALLALFLAGWLILPGSPFLWTLLGITTLAIPVVTSVISWSARQLTSSPQGNDPLQIGDELARWLLGLVSLPTEAVIVLDAIVITLIRVLITRRHLLEWTAAARTDRLFGQSGQSIAIWRQMGIAVILSFGLGWLVFFTQPTALLAAAPLLLAWLLSPMVALRITQPVVVRTERLSDEQYNYLRRLARLTWLYFEQFVGPEGHWLPPDHFQESPRGLVAHRTSPTNIGLLLTSTLSAYDLGYVDLLNLVSRLELTLETLGELVRHRGHFLNWYDTRSLRPLPPRYVSMVDSGNLAACLIVTKQACLELPENPVLSWKRWQGLLDLLDIFANKVRQLEKVATDGVTDHVYEQLESMRRKIITSQGEPSLWAQLLFHLFYVELDELDQRLRIMIGNYGHQIEPEDLRRLRRYTRRLFHHLQSANRELGMLLPWLRLFKEPPELFSSSMVGEEIEAAWSNLVDMLPTTPSLLEIIDACDSSEKSLEELQAKLAALESDHEDRLQLDVAAAWCQELAGELRSAKMSARALLIGIQGIADKLETFLQECDFSFLYDHDRHVFHIGYNLEIGRLDPNYYDLLASESRIGSLVAIAKQNVPNEHWLHLSRPLTQVEGERALLSWSATMFEYLMPEMFMRGYEGTLLNQSCRAAVNHQISYGLEKDVPWGISESGYYSFDSNMNYQYRAFGVPGLGFKRGLGDELVISPYASLLALAIRPERVMQNLELMEEYNLLGTYGFYEAIDFTRAHLPLGENNAVVREYMAHHQGMILLTLVNFLQEKITIQRFHRDPRIQSVEMLLQELVPKTAPLEQVQEDEAQTVRPMESRVSVEPWKVPLHAPVPQVHILSNGRFSTLLNGAGGGYSIFQGTALTRWRADPTLDSYGTWVYIKDLEGQDIWSIGQQPAGLDAETYSANFYPYKVEIQRHDDGISMEMDALVPPEEDLEIRRFTLTNHTDTSRSLRVSSYGEVVLNDLEADRRHPAFTKMFVESEFISDLNALLFRRRPRSSQEEPIFLMHLYTSAEDLNGETLELNYESDRARMLGRGHNERLPSALCNPQEELPGTTGPTLDPVFCLSQAFTLAPHQSLRFAFITLAARSRQEATELAARYQDWSLIERASDQARSSAEVEMRQFGWTTKDLVNIQRLQSVLLYPHRALRAAAEILSTNRLGQSGLWGHEISGDYPILLLLIEDENHLELLAELLRAHTYWRKRGFKVDLVVLNQSEIGYAENLTSQVHRLIGRMESGDWLKRRGGIFILREKRMNSVDVVLLKTAARAVISAEAGSLAEQLEKLTTAPSWLPPFVPTRSPSEAQAPTSQLARPEDLIFDNGFGGFSADGREYLIYLAGDRWTPAPWVNVIANDHFGFLVSETGGGFTWCQNSGENRLTPWKNDPVSDPPGEVIYLRDEETGYVWSPTPLPIREQNPYLITHGAGFTEFKHSSQGLNQSLLLFVPPDRPVKIAQLSLENTYDRVRRITVTYYAEWVLGTHRDTTQWFVIPEFDTETQTILARNPYNNEFGDRVAFLASDKSIHGLTTDRTEFLGRMGSYAQPAALNRIGLSGTIEPGSDPCAALQVHLDLQPGETAEVHFLIGQGEDRAEVQQLVECYRKPDEIENAWQAATKFWDDLLGVVQVETPEPSMNLMLNRWLLYQALSCRIWGRSAFYQSSGAYGFRDQLQDVLAMIFSRPQIARGHILKAALHQFEEGDVLHWWHPPSGRGVRTRIKDDLLWLPFVTAHYVSATGDDSILEEEVPFRTAPGLKPGEEERYGQYPLTGRTYSLYEHCLRALNRGATTGPHSLPLMGTGDWNDGMNRVGVEGIGESVWLAWFLRATLLDFARLCEARGDSELAESYRIKAREYDQAAQAHAWDGEWYLRAFYDDGSALGSANNQECRIDSIAQSWAVLSASGDEQRERLAMASVVENLVRTDDRLVLLYAPSFNHTPRDPGYIKGYPPGVRENGGQYTHAAIWTVWALAQLGQGGRAERFFRLLNPINHSDTEDKALKYKVEPYVIAADVYSNPGYTGRGGWTWYTGSSGWFYRLGLEAILGVSLSNGGMRIDPCIPRYWKGYKIAYRHGQSVYNLIVDNPNGANKGVETVELDGKILDSGLIPLIDDGAVHTVHVVMKDRS
ncbi:MAG TPA: glucoamylase family protein [Anaerolineales bacterium]